MKQMATVNYCLESPIKRSIFRMVWCVAVSACAMGLLWLCSRYHGVERGYALIFFICGAFGLLAIGAALALARRRKWPLEYVFLILFIPLSLMMTVVMPIFGAPDEVAHLNVAWLVSSGQAFSPPSEQRAPKDFFSGGIDLTLREVVCSARSPSARIDSELSPSPMIEATRVYPVFAYLPQAAGMWFAWCFSNNRFALLYGARLGALALTVLMFFLAVKWAPCGKNIVLFISLMPMTLQEASSAAVDGMAIASITLLTAFVMMTRTPEFVMERKHWLVACLLSCGLVAFKVMYAPFLFLFGLVPDRCLGGRRARRIFLATVFCAALASASAWVLSSMMPLFAEGSSQVSSKVVPQVAATLINPLKTARQFGQTILSYADIFVNGFFGQDLSWFTLSIPPFVKMVLIVVLAAIVAQDRPLLRGEGAENVRRRLIVSSVTSLFIVGYALLVWWTDIENSPVINGIQGRYFIPPAFALLLSIRNPQEVSDGSAYPRLWKCYMALAFADMCALAVVFSGKF